MFSKKYPGDMKWLAGLDAGAMDSWVFDGVHVSKIDCYLPMLLFQLLLSVFSHIGFKSGILLLISSSWSLLIFTFTCLFGLMSNIHGEQHEYFVNNMII